MLYRMKTTDFFQIVVLHSLIKCLGGPPELGSKMVVFRGAR